MRAERKNPQELHPGSWTGEKEKLQAERKNPRGMPAGSLADCVFFRVSVSRKGYFPASLSKKVITSSQVLNSSLPNRMAVQRRFSSGMVSMK